jgi:hypothetical protein
MIELETVVPNSYRETSRPHLQTRVSANTDILLAHETTEWRDIDAPQGTTLGHPSFPERTEYERQMLLRGTGRTLLLT